MTDYQDYNRKQWNELVQADVYWSRPFLELTPETAQKELDPQNLLGSVAGKQVLCLASGGGQQSAAFALLGAHVTVFDLSDGQLAQDQKAAAHYGLQIKTEQGDMSDLARFAADSFDIVYHPYSINFVPQVDPVIEGVARVLKPGGHYRFQFANPSAQGIDDEGWHDDHYPLKIPYQDGLDITSYWPYWDFKDQSGAQQKVASPKEYLHRMSTVMNALARNRFHILRWEEYLGQDRPDEPRDPGSWWHYLTFMPSWYTLWMRLLD